MNSMTIDVMGIYVPTVGVLAVLALVLTFALRLVLDRFDFFSLFWHRGIVEVSLFALIFGGVLVLALGPGLPALAFFHSHLHF
jgi:hypothetical protein